MMTTEFDGLWRSWQESGSQPCSLLFFLLETYVYLVMCVTVKKSISLIYIKLFQTNKNGKVQEQPTHKGICMTRKAVEKITFLIKNLIIKQ